MNKKGQDVQLYRYLFIGFFMFLILGLYIFLLSINSGAMRSSATVGLEILATRILYDDAGVIYADANGRAYPGIIDPYKFTTQRLEQSISYPEKARPGVKLTLYEGLETPRTIYLYEREYQSLLPLSEEGMSGAATTQRMIKKVPVLIKLTDGYDKGFLEMTLVMRK